jgi:hypothetical protein
MARIYSNRNGSEGGGRVVRSFGENRTCAAQECRTRLSRYNPDEWCFAHRDRIPQQPIHRRQA